MMMKSEAVEAFEQAVKTHNHGCEVREYAEKQPREVPIWEKSNLTVEEAALYSGIGRGKLREISEDESCGFVLWVGTKRLLKRKKLDEYLEGVYSL